MEVFQDEQYGVLVSQEKQEIAQGDEDALSELFRFQLGKTLGVGLVGGGNPQDVFQIGAMLGVARSQYLLPQAAERSPQPVFRGVLGGVDEIAQSVAEQPVSHAAAVGQAEAFHDADALPGGGLGLPHQAAFADAALAANEYQPSAAPPAQGFDGLRQPAQFFLAPDQRRADALQPAYQAALGAFSDDLVGCDALGDALEFHRRQTQEAEDGPRLPVNGLAGQNGARRGSTFQAAGEVDGIADGGVIHHHVGADIPHDDRPGMQAGMKFDGSPLILLAQFLVERGYTGLHIQRGAHSKFRMALYGNRRSEKGHQPVSQEFVHKAVEFVHALGHCLQVFLYQVIQFLRVQLCRQRGVAGEVHKQDGHVATLSDDIQAGRAEPVGQIGAGQLPQGSTRDERLGTLR